MIIIEFSILLICLQYTFNDYVTTVLNGLILLDVLRKTISGT